MKLSETLKRNIIFAVAAVNLLIAVLTILAAYGGKFNPDTTTIPAILSMTFPGWIILTAFALVCDLFLSRRIALVPMVTIFICLPPLLAYSPLNFNSKDLTPEQENSSFTLMSYNVYELSNFINYSDSLKAVTSDDDEKNETAGNPTLGFIVDEATDVACLQECPYIGPSKSKDITAEQTTLFNNLYPNKERVSGEVVFTRFPITPVKLRQPESSYAIFSAAIADIYGHETLLVCVHLESIGLKDDDIRLYRRITEGAKTNVKKVKRQLLGKLSHAFRERALQARMLREQIDSLNIKNVIIAGDFNDITDSYAMRTLAGDDFRNAFSTAGFGPQYTYHGNRLYFHIDHILYRGDMKAVDYQCVKTGGSDHYPVMAKFIWE